MIRTGLQSFRVFLTSALPMFYSKPGSGAACVLHSGTLVTVTLVEDLRAGEVTPGQMIITRVVMDVRSGGCIAIAQATIATLEIVEVQQAALLGRPDRLILCASATTSRWGSSVVRKGTYSISGEDKRLQAIMSAHVLLVASCSFQARQTRRGKD